MSKDQHKSEIAKAIEQRKRPSKILPVNLAIGVLAEPIRKIAFRIPTLAEDRDAVNRAYGIVRNSCSTDEARQDGDVLTNAKLVCALYHACREVVTKKDAIGAEIDEEGMYAAFPAPEWMYEHLTADQVGVLCNMFTAVRAELSPAKTFDTEAAETILRVTGALPDDNVPAALFSEFSRDGLAQIVVHAARSLAGARAALAETEKQPEGHRLVDVEHAALVLKERAERDGDASALASASALLGAVAVLRGERPAETLVESP